MKKVQVTLWNHDAKQNEVTEATFMHWGISHQELNNGIGHYTVAFVMLSDGTVKEVYPTNIKFEVDERFEVEAVLLPIDEKKQKLEKAASKLLKGCLAAIAIFRSEGIDENHPIVGQVFAEITSAVKNATE